MLFCFSHSFSPCLSQGCHDSNRCNNFLVAKKKKEKQKIETNSILQHLLLNQIVLTIPTFKWISNITAFENYIAITPY